MKTKICPICDQKIKGNYCKVCHQFVTPVVYDSDFKLNESRDGADYFELQLEREKTNRKFGGTDLDDGHTNHPQVNQPKDRRIENINGREMRTTQMPSSYQPRQNTQTRPQTGFPQRQVGSFGNGSERKKNPGGLFAIIFIIILIIEIIASVASGMRSNDDWGSREQFRPAAVWEAGGQSAGNHIEGEDRA